MLHHKNINSNTPVQPRAHEFSSVSGFGLPCGKPSFACHFFTNSRCLSGHEDESVHFSTSFVKILYVAKPRREICFTLSSEVCSAGCKR
jgi:hypothetical protein